MILHDQHVHSSFSMDSNELIENYYELAKDNHCKYFVTTEHLDLDLGGSGKDWLVDFDGLKLALDNLSNLKGPICLLGVELGYRRDSIDRAKEILSKYQFDVINLSIHDNGKMDYYFTPGFIKYGVDETLSDYYDRMIEAVTNYDDFDVLSHIDYGYKTVFQIDPNKKFSQFEDKIKKIMEVLIKKGKALEINTKVQEAFPLEHTKYILDLYYNLGGRKLTLSSDAHQQKRYMSSFPLYMKLIKEVGFSYLCYYVKRSERHFDL